MDGTVILRHSIRASMRDGAVLRGYYYEREIPVARGRYAITAHPTPLLCIPTELGNSQQHHEFALRLARLNGAPKRIYTIDLRGRGASELGTTTAAETEIDTEDLITFCEALGLHGADLIVNGRSAIAVLLTGPKRPSLFNKLVFNDAAPMFDGVGIARLTALRQRQQIPKNWGEALANLKQLKGEDFPLLSDADWDGLVHAIWKEEKGKLLPSISAGLVRQTNAVSYEEKQLQAWQELKIFQNNPSLLIRGENSQLLSDEIAAQFSKSMADFQTITAKGQGHVPLLYLDNLPDKILSFLREEETDT